MKKDSSLEDIINTKIEEYNSEIRPLIEPLYRLVPEHHGILHIDFVVAIGIYIASKICPDKINQVIIACCLHDCARVNDDYDLYHERNAIPKIISFFDLYGHLLGFTDKDVKDIIYAVSNHTSGFKTNNVIAQCLWDSDRIRMAIEYGYDEKYFNTNVAKEIIQDQQILDYIKKLLNY